ncbi:MAG TPA: NTP transferase domain-containing protein, partial [Devosiaceae bacterium]|nr:NTP transferase domain-containing protein [Devosiaceae bacterium]
FVTAGDFTALAHALADAGEKSIAAAAFGGRRGHPVLFARRRFEALRELTGDTGAGGILAAHAADVLLVPSGNHGVLDDIDTREDLARAEAAIRQRLSGAGG